MSRAEKARSKAMLTLHKNIIATVYEPLKLYPYLFLAVLLGDIVMFAFVSVHELMCSCFSMCFTHAPTGQAEHI